MVRWIFRSGSRAAAGILAAVAVFAAAYAGTHGVAPATGLGLAAFLLVTARPGPRPIARGLLPVLVRQLVTVAAYLLVLTVTSTVFRSLAAGVGFGLSALYVLDRYWPAPQLTVLADLVTMAVYVVLFAAWVWLTHGDFSLILLLAFWAAVSAIARIRVPAPPDRSRTPDQPQWPRSIGPRPLG